MCYAFLDKTNICNINNYKLFDIFQKNDNAVKEYSR